MNTMFIDADKKPYKITITNLITVTSKKLSPAALFDESSAIAKSPNSSSSSSMESSMGGGDEDTIGGIMLDMLASCHSITQEAPYTQQNSVREYCHAKVWLTYICYAVTN